VVPGKLVNFVAQ